MNYIVVDLEWNQSPEGKAHENKLIPFEIIEIGAVKLDSQFRKIDEVECLIRPQIYKQLHHKTKEIINIELSELQKGLPFEKAMKAFLKWCEKDYVFCTWGNMDLLELQRNMHFYGMEIPFHFPLIFYDIQKFFSILHEDGKIRRSLQYVIDYLKIDESEEFHRAINDARYTGIVMQNIDMESAQRFYSIDCYRIPENKKEEIHATYENYEKYISRGFESREETVADGEVSSTRCYICGRNCKRLIKWFSTNNKMYYGLFSCMEHGYMKGRIRTKKAENGQYYAIKILKLTDEQGAAAIRERQKLTREKRRLKRQQDMQQDKKNSDS